jgi:hypothetical protein
MKEFKQLPKAEEAAKKCLTQLANKTTWVVLFD